MFKLMQNVGIRNGIKNIRIAGNVFACRSFSDETPNMEKTINTISLMGRAGNDPLVKGNDEHPVVTFSLATHNNYKTEGGEWIQRVDWHKIAVFKPNLRAAVQNYLTKGHRILVNGKISYGQIQDNDGKPKQVTTIIADEVFFFH